MDEQNRYFKSKKNLIDQDIPLTEPLHCEQIIKDVKEECILYDHLHNFEEQNLVQAFTNFSDISKQKLSLLLTEISSLSSKEKLLLYFKIPSGTTETDPLRQHQNPLGTRLEISRTINWIKSHLEHDPEVSIPKQDVYNDYHVFCKTAHIKPLSTADFGKVMKQVFPDVKPRRLGTRGNSRYCYAAMRKVTKLMPPNISVADNFQNRNIFEEIDVDSWSVIQKWTEEVTHVSFSSLKEFATHIKKNNLNVLNPSKLILQRKYMQRYTNKKKFCDLNIKRKKKKKRKNSYTDLVSDCISPISLKVEECSDSNNSLNGSILTPVNLAVDNSAFPKTDINIFHESRVESNLNKSSTASKDSNLDVEISSHEHLQAESCSTQILNKNLPISNQNLSQNDSLMGPPQFYPNSEHYTNNLSLRKRLMCESGKNLIKTVLNNAGESDCVHDDKDVLLQNLLPRERVISICNMDKHELDDYLNSIENQDEQDGELLQYFQGPESITKTEENLINVENKGISEISVKLPVIFDENSLPKSKNSFELFSSKSIEKKVLNTKPPYSSACFTNLKINSQDEIASDLYTRNSEEKILKTDTNLTTNILKNRYNFVPIPVNGNSIVNPARNITNSCTEYNTKLCNPAISASAPTSPNILKQNVPNYPFYCSEKYESLYNQSLMDSTLKVSNNDNLEYRSRSVPLNSPKMEKTDGYFKILECNAVNANSSSEDIDSKILLSGLEFIDATLNPLNVSEQNIYNPRINNLQKGYKRMYVNLAQSSAINKTASLRSSRTAPLSTRKNLLFNDFELNLNKDNKLFDLSKSMPTTPIESEILTFRYSPETKFSSNIGNENNVLDDLKEHKNIPIFNQYKESNINDIGQIANLEDSFNKFDTDRASEILKKL